jgi:hypothetical protein
MRSILIATCWLFASLAHAPKPGAAHRGNDVDVAGRTIHFTLGTVAQSVEIQVSSP